MHQMLEMLFSQIQGADLFYSRLRSMPKGSRERLSYSAKLDGCAYSAFVVIATLLVLMPAHVLLNTLSGVAVVNASAAAQSSIASWQHIVNGAAFVAIALASLIGGLCAKSVIAQIKAAR